MPPAKPTEEQQRKALEAILDMDTRTGVVRFELWGETKALPCPDLGQHREILTLWDVLEQEEKEQVRLRNDPPEDAPEDWAPPEITPDEIGDWEERRGETFRKMGEILGVEFTRIPPWVTFPSLPQFLIGHWSSYPFRALGASPPPTTDE